MTNHSLLEEAKQMQSRIVEWRRDFHQHPELGFEEFRTSGIVANYLTELGLDVQTGVGKTGVIGLLHGKSPGPTILLRADMDALPIVDAKTVSYRSKTDGKAHLCGHDAHTSMLMAAAKLLVDKGLEKGNVKFMFQPAEEGLAGAKAMIDDGLLEDPNVDAAAALHVSALYPSGKVALAPGAMWAATNKIYIRITGVGGHAASPHRTIDPIPIAAQIITALQQIASRQVDPLDSVVVTIGKIQGGFTENVISQDVELRGTVRTFNPELRSQMKQKIQSIIKGITEAFGASYEFTFHDGYPVLVNDKQMVELVRRVGVETLGETNVEGHNPAMGGEDFSFVAERVPSIMFRLGTNGGEQSSYPGHHPKFDVDENALPCGAAMLAAIALDFLGKGSRR